MGLLSLVMSVVLSLSPASPDAAFLRDVEAAGISHNGPQRAIDAAHAVCELAKTESSVDVLQSVVITNPGMTQAQAATFITLAAIHYCPDQL